MSILGSRVLRVEDPRLLTDGGTYCADVRDGRLEGAVHATYVRSTVAHGPWSPWTSRPPGPCPGWST
jgi:carbon-monoxide dehydrogenase large subunit